jgi:hypothetical protein
VANDRLYLVCPECGEGFMLGKRYGDAWSVRNHSSSTFEEMLDGFFDKHYKCRAGEVDDPSKFLLFNELELDEYHQQLSARTN